MIWISGDWRSGTGSGGVVDVHCYAGEGHGFSKCENRFDTIKRMVGWFDKYREGGR